MFCVYTYFLHIWRSDLEGTVFGFVEEDNVSVEGIGLYEFGDELVGVSADSGKAAAVHASIDAYAMGFHSYN